MRLLVVELRLRSQSLAKLSLCLPLSAYEI